MSRDYYDPFLGNHTGVWPEYDPAFGSTQVPYNYDTMNQIQHTVPSLHLEAEADKRISKIERYYEEKIRGIKDEYYRKYRDISPVWGVNDADTVYSKESTINNDNDKKEKVKKIISYYYKRR